MADIGRWRDAAGEPAAGPAVDTDRPEPSDLPERPERDTPTDDHPGLRGLYADDPDDIFDTDDILGSDGVPDSRARRDADAEAHTEAHTEADTDRDRDTDEHTDAGADADRAGSYAERDPHGEPGDRPHGEPPPDRPDEGAPGGTRPDEPAGTADSFLRAVDRPRVPDGKDLTYGSDLTHRDGRLVRPPLFDGPPSREQAMQGDLNDCGVVAAMGAVAGHRPEAVRDLVSQRPDGGYLVRLHQVQPTERGLFVPTGKRIELAVTPELPVWSAMPHRAAFADTYWTGVSWAAVLEKALAGVDAAWPDERLSRYGTSGYDRLDLGTYPWDRAELLATLTGETAADIRLDTGSGNEPAVERWLGGRLDAREPLLVATRAGDDEGELPHDLASRHVYEVVDVGDGLVRLHNPWGSNHPEPLTVRELLDAITPSVVTLWDREQV